MSWILKFVVSCCKCDQTSNWFWFLLLYYEFYIYEIKQSTRFFWTSFLFFAVFTFQPLPSATFLEFQSFSITRYTYLGYEWSWAKTSASFTRHYLNTWLKIKLSKPETMTWNRNGSSDGTYIKFIIKNKYMEITNTKPFK